MAPKTPTYLMPFRRFITSIRGRLAILVLIAALPLLGVILYGHAASRHDAARTAHANALRLAENLAGYQDLITQNSRQMLQTLAQLPAVQQQRAPECRTIFRNLLQRNPVYREIFAARPDGRVFVSTARLAVFDISDRKYFHEVRRTGRFAVGEFAIGKSHPSPTLHFAHPVLDGKGRLRAIVVAALQLSIYDQFTSRTQLPPGYVLGVIDHQGILLYCHPVSPRMRAGTKIPDEIIAAVKRSCAESFESAGADGVERFYAHQGLRLTPQGSPYLYVFAGVSKATALQKARKELNRDLAALGAVILLALAAAVFMGKWTIVTPLRRLIRASRNLGHGRLSARTGLPHGLDEIGQLAAAFDEMAESLEEEDRKRREAEQALRESEQRYLLLSITDGLTGLYNARFFQEQLEREIRRSERYGHPLTLLMIDIDNFKAFNDRYGHVRGDRVLMRIGRIMNNTLRKTDAAYRYGGEEFVVLLPETDTEQGHAIGERIRLAFREPYGIDESAETVTLTLSVGIAERQTGETGPDLVYRADQKMYEAKRAGKDRVCR